MDIHRLTLPGRSPPWRHCIFCPLPNLLECVPTLQWVPDTLNASIGGVRRKVLVLLSEIVSGICGGDPTPSLSQQSAYGKLEVASQRQWSTCGSGRKEVDGSAKHKWDTFSDSLGPLRSCRAWRKYGNSRRVHSFVLEQAGIDLQRRSAKR